MYPIIVTSHVVTFNAISVYINKTNVHPMTNNKWNNFAQGSNKRELSIKSTIASNYGDNIKAKDFNQLITISQCKYEFAST